jgi:hypothetical protein
MRPQLDTSGSSPARAAAAFLDTVHGRVKHSGVAVSGDSLLLRAGLVRPEQLAEAQRLRRREGGTTGECLVRLGAITEEQLVEFFHQRLLVPRISNDDLLGVGADALAAIPSDMASEFVVLPVKVDTARTLTIAMADPSDSHVVEEVSFFSGRFCQRAVAPASLLRKAIERHYGVRPRPMRPSERSPLLSRGALRPGRIRTPPDVAAATLGEPVVLLTQVKIERPPTVVEPPLALPPKGRRSRHAPAPAAPPAGARATTEGEPPIPLTNPVARGRTLPGMPAVALPELPIEALQSATHRDQIAAALLAYASGIARRSALLVSRKGALAGFDGCGDGVHLAALRELRIPLERPSLFRDVVQSRLAYRGALRDPVLERALGSVFDAPQLEDVLLLPISVGGRAVCVLYAEAPTLPVPEEALHRLADEAGHGYERLIRSARR